MADSNIGALPQAPQLDDDSLLVAEQQGQAMKVTGAQFKEFGRQAVVGQVQSYVDAAQAAAKEAVSAVSAVTGMTVEAHPGQEAAVSRSERDGKVHLSFTLPRGEQGIPGPEGPVGARGPRGETGKGLDILGYYDSLEALKGAVTAPEAGDAYGVGTEPPYSIYVFDGVTLDWKDNGQLSGGGEIVPENVVTAPGGAEMEFSSGEGPHKVTFSFEEEPPLTAEDIVYSDTQTVKEAMEGLFTSVSDGKQRIASAVTDMGVPTAQDATFAQMEENIRQISTGGDASDATATSFDILAGKTAYTATGKVEGTIPTRAAQTITPGTADQTIANGQYLGGTQVIKGDPNLTSGNIKSGVTLFGVEGALESTFQATLTVTADVGAVVTATHTGGTEVEALSTTGTVVLELPLEGTWSVTAVRGVAQYNTVTINVTSQYTAALTPAIHLEYIGITVQLPTVTQSLAATSIGNAAVFGGGITDAYHAGAANLSAMLQRSVIYCNAELTTWNAANMRFARSNLSAAHNNQYALFAGGKASDGTVVFVEAYGTDSSRTDAQDFSSYGAEYIGATAIGTYAVFAGGQAGSTQYNTVAAYDESLTKTGVTSLVIAGRPSGAANDNYAFFGAGNTDSGIPTAYDSSLTRHVPTTLSQPRKGGAAAKAGNYVLFAGGYSASGNKLDVVDAYDLFLTRTLATNLSAVKADIEGASVNDFAIFAGDNEFADYYDPYLTRTKVTGTPRINLAATAAGNYALVAGGYDEKSGLSADIIAYHYV